MSNQHIKSFLCISTLSLLMAPLSIFAFTPTTSECSAPNEDFTSIASCTTPSGVEVSPSKKNTQPEVSVMKNALVKAIGEEKIFVLGDGLDDLEYNYTILILTPETIVPPNLKVGDYVDVKHSPVVTASLPPQTVAFELELVAEPIFPELSFIPSATIVAINSVTGQITVLPTGLENTPSHLIVLNASDETVICHEASSSPYRLEDLKVGMQISAKHSPLMTFSIPPQTPVYQITILK